MKFGVLGTGAVGKALAGKLVLLGHDVVMGTRGTDNKSDLAGKILIDVSNPLDLSKGMQAVTLTICNNDSLGETIQREFPELRVVKALNTCNSEVMGSPDRVPGDHDLFIAGNDSGAKEQVCDLLRSFGWRSFLDLGDITAARGTEALMLIWLRLLGKFGNTNFNYKIVRAEQESKS